MFFLLIESLPLVWTVTKIKICQLKNCKSFFVFNDFCEKLGMSHWVTMVDKNKKKKINFKFKVYVLMWELKHISKMPKICTILYLIQLGVCNMSISLQSIQQPTTISRLKIYDDPFRNQIQNRFCGCLARETFSGDSVVRGNFVIMI